MLRKQPNGMVYADHNLETEIVNIMDMIPNTTTFVVGGQYTSTAVLYFFSQLPIGVRRRVKSYGFKYKFEAEFPNGSRLLFARTSSEYDIDRIPEKIHILVSYGAGQLSSMLPYSLRAMGELPQGITKIPAVMQGEYSLLFPMFKDNDTLYTGDDFHAFKDRVMTTGEYSATQNFLATSKTIPGSSRWSDKVKAVMKHRPELMELLNEKGGKYKAEIEDYAPIGSDDEVDLMFDIDPDIRHEYELSKENIDRNYKYVNIMGEAHKTGERVEKLAAEYKRIRRLQAQK